MSHQSLITNHQSLQNSVVLHNVSKKYSLSQERPVLLKNIFIPQKKEEVWALKNVTLNIKKGETIGIIGENGSGKSTLLKIIAGITSPTNGTVKINGKVGSLIELGAGFHQDLTGRENIYLNGTLLGFTKKELDKKYDEIVEFADIGEFINQPIRTYSSGMTVRLGFSVAIHLDPEILLLDEILAVGDEEFQYKSAQKIKDFQKMGKTIIVVSHNLLQIKNQTSCILLLKHGKKVSFASSSRVINQYFNSVKFNPYNNSSNKKTQHSKNSYKEYVVITKVNCLDYENKPKTTFNPQETFGIQIIFLPKKKLNKLMFGVAIFKQGIYLFGTKKEISIGKNYVGKKQSLVLKIKSLPFLKGEYSVSVGACIDNQWSNPFDFKENAVSFGVKESYGTINYDGWITTRHVWKLF